MLNDDDVLDAIAYAQSHNHSLKTAAKKLGVEYKHLHRLWRQALEHRKNEVDTYARRQTYVRVESVSLAGIQGDLIRLQVTVQSSKLLDAQDIQRCLKAYFGDGKLPPGGEDIVEM